MFKCICVNILSLLSGLYPQDLFGLQPLNKLMLPYIQELPMPKNMDISKWHTKAQQEISSNIIIQQYFINHVYIWSSKTVNK